MFTLDEPITVEQHLFKGGTPLSPPHSWGPPRLSGIKFCHEILETPSYHTVKTGSLYINGS